eukprot:SAG11_NODE_6374_length_1327_cov_0.959283_1_plen_379_part_01
MERRLQVLLVALSCTVAACPRTSIRRPWLASGAQRFEECEQLQEPVGGGAAAEPPSVGPHSLWYATSAGCAAECSSFLPCIDAAKGQPFLYLLRVLSPISSSSASRVRLSLSLLRAPLALPLHPPLHFPPSPTTSASCSSRPPPLLAQRLASPPPLAVPLPLPLSHLAPPLPLAVPLAPLLNLALAFALALALALALPLALPPSASATAAASRSAFASRSASRYVSRSATVSAFASALASAFASAAACRSASIRSTSTARCASRCASAFTSYTQQRFTPAFFYQGERETPQNESDRGMMARRITMVLLSLLALSLAGMAAPCSELPITAYGAIPNVTTTTAAFTNQDAINRTLAAAAMAAPGCTVVVPPGRFPSFGGIT